MNLCQYSRRFLALLTAVLLFAAPAAATQWQFDGVERVVALSDIHGAYEPMVRTLQSAAVIDDTLGSAIYWIAVPTRGRPWIC